MAMHRRDQQQRPADGFAGAGRRRCGCLRSRFRVRTRTRIRWAWAGPFGTDVGCRGVGDAVPTRLPGSPGTNPTRRGRPVGLPLVDDQRQSRPTNGLPRYLGRPPRPAIARMIGYRTAMPGVHRGLPGPWLTLVFPLSGELPIDVPEGGSLRSGSYAIPVGGLHTRPVYLPPPPGTGAVPCRDPNGACSSTCIRSPRATCSGCRPANSAGGCSNSAISSVPMPARLTDDLGGGVDGRRAAAVVAEWIERAAGRRRRRPARAGARHAWRLIVGSAGRCRIGDVAAEVGWSRRHLTARLRSRDRPRSKGPRQGRPVPTRPDPDRPRRATAGRHRRRAAATPTSRTCRPSGGELAGCTIGQWMAQDSGLPLAVAERTDE